MSFSGRLSNFPFLNFTKKKTQEYYFGLNIQSDKVVASVWGISGNRVEIVNTAQRPYASLDSTSDSGKEILEASNYALDEALADFEPEPSKILFGVPDNWLLDEELKAEYLKILKQMVRELDLAPLAYVSTTHAICHLLAKLSGVPITTILVNISDPLSVSVVKAGQILGTKNVKRSSNLPEDIEKALLTFADVEVLPSKILIYGEEDPHKYKEELLSFGWMAQLPFLHLPKIENLDKDITIQSISFAGASEISPDISISQHDLEIKSGNNNDNLKKISKPLETYEKKKLEDLGFVEGDIKELMDTEESSNKDNMNIEVYHKRHPQKHHNEHHVTHHRQITIKDRLFAPINILASIHIPGIPTSFSAYPSRIIIIPILILIGLIVTFIFFQKATVTIFVDLKTLEKEATVIADPTVSVIDENNKTIPGKIVSEDVTGTGKGSATGKKKVGEAAKGTVVIYNKTNSAKNFSTGTILQSDNLTFKLDTQVNIASQSAVDGGISFGKATANVIAEQIGPDGNLAAGKELSIKGFNNSEYSAKVDTAFSGGISKDVNVVTIDDQKKLLAQVSSDLRKKAQEKIQEKLSSGEKILEEGLTEKITKQIFSKNVSDQASELTLNLSANYKGTSYKEDDLRLIVSKLVEVNVPEGYSLDLSKTETQADVSKIEKDGKLIFTSKFRAKLMPKLDPEHLKKDIAGKNPTQASERLKQIENVIGSDIRISPPLPVILQRLPFLSKNITLEVTAK